MCVASQIQKKLCFGLFSFIALRSKTCEVLFRELFVVAAHVTRVK